MLQNPGLRPGCTITVFTHFSACFHQPASQYPIVTLSAHNSEIIKKNQKKTKDFPNLVEQLKINKYDLLGIGCVLSKSVLVKGFNHNIGLGRSPGGLPVHQRHAPLHSDLTNAFSEEPRTSFFIL